jgi:hypothetical protein
MAAFVKKTSGAINFSRMDSYSPEHLGLIQTHRTHVKRESHVQELYVRMGYIIQTSQLKLVGGADQSALRHCQPSCQERKRQGGRGKNQVHLLKIRVCSGCTHQMGDSRSTVPAICLVTA